MSEGDEFTIDAAAFDFDGPAPDAGAVVRRSSGGPWRSPGPTDTPCDCGCCGRPPRRWRFWRRPGRVHSFDIYWNDERWPSHRKGKVTQVAEFDFTGTTTEATATVVAKDAGGAEVTPTDALVWTADDNGAVVTLIPSADGLTCTFTRVAPGTSNATVTDPATNVAAALTVRVPQNAVASLEVTVTPVN